MNSKLEEENYHGNNPTTGENSVVLRRKYYSVINTSVMILVGLSFAYILYFMGVTDNIFPMIVPEKIEGVVHKDNKIEATALVDNQSTINHGNDNNETNKNIGEVSSYSVLKPIPIEQIETYKNGTGLILNIHVTHHGGTTFCALVGRSSGGISPQFACMGDRENIMNGTQPRDKPWTNKDDTANKIAMIRPYFHMISWEFSSAGKIPLSATDWENPNLLSVYVTRDPMSRLLSGMGPYSKRAVGYGSDNFTKHDWWNFAKGEGGFPPRVTDNYALRILAGNGCCQGADTSIKHLEDAKTLLNRFSIILDIACLDNGIDALADLLNITLNESRRKKRKSEHHASVRERIGHDDVYEYLLEKNKPSIELYEWSKTKALIQCPT